MVLLLSLDLDLTVLVLLVLTERALLMRDSPNKTLHVVPTLSFPPAQKAIDFFVVRRRRRRTRTRTTTADPFLPFDCPLTD